MDNNLKLFVWEDVLCQYTCGMMFALAHDVEEARSLLRKSDMLIDGDEIAKEPKLITKPAAYAVYGSS